jgi:FkbM family methyltransferase
MIGSNVMRKQLRRLIRRTGYEVRRCRPNLGQFLSSRDIDLFLDVGGNVGQTGLQLRDMGYRGRIVSFEPVRDAFNELMRAVERDGNWSAYNFALGTQQMRTSINVSENTVFSSILHQTEEACRFDPSARVCREEIIDVQRLDDIYERFSGRRVFLKIVTQGFEREVLEGAQRAMKDILGVELILPIVQLYENNWSFPEAILYMKNKGFVLAQTGQESYEAHGGVTLLELYCIFRRENNSTVTNSR